ncbi:hypothetical protein HYR99_11935 [Candidatus Poribacteria bacterium]|nr:hypothetical protein [Candidatus Poribacteria bacterium]
MPMTTNRFLTAEGGVEQLLKQTPPLHFAETSKEAWRKWRKSFRRNLVRNLGPKPEAVPLEVEVLERAKMDGYTREKLIFNPDPFSSIPAYILIPDGASRDNPRPAVLCAHGHGAGKDPLVGLGADYQKQFAVELARLGFITIAPDWRCFGERKDRDEWVRRPGRDGCNVAYLAYGYFGYLFLRRNHDHLCLGAGWANQGGHYCLLPQHADGCPQRSRTWEYLWFAVHVWVAAAW